MSINCQIKVELCLNLFSFSGTRVALRISIFFLGHSFIKRMPSSMFSISGFRVGRIGKGGGLLSDFGDAELAAISKFCPQFVFLQIGGNDIVSPVETPATEQARVIATGLKKLVVRILDLGVGKVLVGEILFRKGSRGVSQLEYHHTRVKVNRTLRKVLNKVDGAEFVNFRGLNIDQHLKGDGVHLNKQGYHSYCHAILDRIKK